MKRLVIELDDKAHATFKSKAAAAGMTMTSIVLAAVTDYNAGKWTPAAKRSAKGTKPIK